MRSSIYLKLLLFTQLCICHKFVPPLIQRVRCHFTITKFMTFGLIALFMPVSILERKKFASTESLIETTNFVYVVLYSESFVF